MERFERITGLINRNFNWIAGGGLVIMLVLTVADVLAVKLLNTPIPGAIELVSFLSLIVVAFSLAYTQQLKGHIQVEFFVSRLPERLRAAVGVFVCLLAIVLFVLLAWRSIEFGRVLQASGEVSMTQRIPFYPFVYAVAVCCLPMCLQLALQLVGHLRRLVKP